MPQEPAQLPLLPALVLSLTDWFQTQQVVPPMIGWYETRVPGSKVTHMRLWRGDSADRGWGYPMSENWTPEQNFAYQWLDNPNQAAAVYLEWRGVVPGSLPESCYPYALHLTSWRLVAAQYPDFRKPPQVALIPVDVLLASPAPAPAPKPRVSVRAMAAAQEPEAADIPLAAWVDVVPAPAPRRPRVRVLTV